MCPKAVFEDGEDLFSVEQVPRWSNEKEGKGRIGKAEHRNENQEKINDFSQDSYYSKWSYVTRGFSSSCQFPNNYPEA